MRLTLKVITLAVAVLFVLSSGTALAQTDKAKRQWEPIAVSALPMKVYTGHHRLFAHDKITKVEKSTSTAEQTLYRLTTQRKGQPTTMVFDASGNLKR
jgi:hypothetical protein